MSSESASTSTSMMASGPAGGPSGHRAHPFAYPLSIPAHTLILQEIQLLTTHLRRSSPRFSSQATSQAVGVVANLRMAELQRQRQLHVAASVPSVQIAVSDAEGSAQMAERDGEGAEATSGSKDEQVGVGTRQDPQAASAAAAVLAHTNAGAQSQGKGHARTPSGTIGAVDEQVLASTLGVEPSALPATSASPRPSTEVDTSSSAVKPDTQSSTSMSAKAAATQSSNHRHHAKGSASAHTATLPSTSNQARKQSAGSSSLRNGTSSTSAAGGIEEVEILASFVVLKRELAEVDDFTQLSPLALLRPFLGVVRSPLTSGAITALALSTVQTFVINFLPAYLPTEVAEALTARSALPIAPDAFTHPTAPTELQTALSVLTTALARCKFPSASPAQDELVLLRLLKVAEALVTSPLESQLTDEGVCEVLEVGLGMGGRARLSEGLRKTAQATVQSIVRAGFMRLRQLDPGMLESTADLSSTVGPSIDGQAKGADQGAPETSEPERQSVTKSSRGPSNDNQETAEPSRVGELPSTEGAALTYTPYGLPTLVELFRVLISLLDPSDLTHTDSMRISALSVLNAALEVGGHHIGKWDELLEGLKDEGCRYLFQLIRSDNLNVLVLALRTTSTLFSTLLPHFKLQFELFLTFMIDRLTPQTPTPIPAHLQHIRRQRSNSMSSRASAGTQDSDHLPSTPRFNADLPAVAFDTKELMLETLTQLMRNKSFMVDLWTNYDCDLDSENMFERVIEFLARGVYPSGLGSAGNQSLEGLDSNQTICFEALLGFVDAMNDRLGKPQTWTGTIPLEQLHAQKSRKAKLLAGVAAFNAKPKKGVQFLRENNLIEETESQNSTLALATFLKKTPRLDKKVLGDYISTPENLELLKAFIGLFDFRGKTMADAMRELLEAFRLPGEASPIARITEVFAEHFHSFNPPEIASKDAAYVLAYSVILLNTDQHNPQNRRRMTIEDYQKNLRGVNDGKDFSPEYLASIHESIRQREIIMPQEHVGQAGFDYAWKGLMARSRAVGSTIVCNTPIFDQQMFEISWRPLISAIASAFTTTTQDEYITQKAIKGFRQCAMMAGNFKLPEVIDTIVLSLSSATDLLDEDAPDGSVASFPVVERDCQSIVVSPLSIRFGTSFRSQLATIVLFTIANGNGDAIREGWTQIFEMFQNLFLHSLLPQQLWQKADFLSGPSAIPLKVTKSQPVREERRAESGLLSTLSSYLLSPYGASVEALTTTSDDDVENTLSALDCISACNLDELFDQIHNLSSESMIAALQALRMLAETRCVPHGRSRSSLTGKGEDLSGRPLTPSPDDGPQSYDPGCVFDVELMISLASRAPENIIETWPIIFDFIAAVLSSAQSYSIIFVERTVVGLLKLCLIIAERPKLRDQLYVALDVLRSLPSSVLNSVSEQLMSGIAKILEKDRNVVRSHTEWGLVIALFRATVAHPEASKVTLALVQKMSVGEVGSGLSVDNFGGIVALLDEFATAAGAAASRQLVAKSARSGQPARTLGPTVERGLIALESLYEMRNAIPSLLNTSTISAMEAWSTFWLPPLLVIAKHCVNACQEIRQRAVGYLQRLLLSPQLVAADDAAIPAVFGRILFPVIEELLKPQVYERDPAGIEETQMRAATLLCKVFLQYLPRLMSTPDPMVQIMSAVLDLLERFMRTSRKEHTMEQVQEICKNLTLVMYSSGLLLRPPSSGPDTRTDLQKSLWAAASQKLQFLPGFLDETIPPAASQETATAATT